MEAYIGFLIFESTGLVSIGMYVWEGGVRKRVKLVEMVVRLVVWVVQRK